MTVIPTSYRGIRYRSRSEARWAVVFDVLGWRYYYEPEGFALPSGTYLPDFFLPDVEAYFEVKGREPTDREIRLADELAVATECIVVVSHGPPNPHRQEWDRDLSIFYPERSVDDEVFADWHQGGFVSARRTEHPTCSIDCGNLAFLGCNTSVGWGAAFRLAATHRFGVFE